MPAGYDIIGGVRGSATQLEAPLGHFGYRIACRAGEFVIYQYPHPRTVFVGDLIDTGNEHLRTLQIVKGGTQPAR